MIRRADTATLSPCPPSSRGHSPLPAVLDDPSTLPKGDCCLRPSLDRKLICSHGQLAIVDAGQLLDDRLTVIVPHVDAMSEIRPAVHDLFKSSSISNAACVQSWARLRNCFR